MGFYRVLIVDDDESVRNFLAALFSKHGHTWDTAINGAEALEKIKKNSLDAVVTDIKMPHMDGIALTKELVKLHPDLPIMIITAQGNEYTAESAVDAGADEFIKKPFSILEFILRFNKMMNHNERLRRIKQKRDEMIFNLNRESYEKMQVLKKKIEALEQKAYRLDRELWE